MSAPRSVIIDIETKGLSHDHAHVTLAKDGKFVVKTFQQKTEPEVEVLPIVTSVKVVTSGDVIVVEELNTEFEQLTQVEPTVDAQVVTDDPTRVVSDKKSRKEDKKNKKL